MYSKTVSVSLSLNVFLCLNRSLPPFLSVFSKWLQQSALGLNIVGETMMIMTPPGYSHLDYSCPSRASHRMTSPPTWRCRSSTRRWLRWTFCRQWPQGLSISPGSSLPGGRNRDKEEREGNVLDCNLVSLYTGWFDMIFDSLLLFKAKAKLS